MINFLFQFSGNQPETNVPSGTPSLQINRTRAQWAVEGRFVSRPSISIRNGITICTYRTGDSNGDTVNEDGHIRFSNDYGETWSDEDKYLDGTSITGFPMHPVGADYGDPKGPIVSWHYLMPNGNLVMHMWKTDYSSITAAEGTHQTISTDGGKTWSTPTQIDFSNSDADRDLRLQAGDDHFLYNNIMYAAVRETETRQYFTPGGTWLPIKNVFIKSEDYGVTWDVISDITDFTTFPTHETALEYVGNNTIIALSRAKLFDKTIKSKSTDFGLNWTVTDITDTAAFTGAIGRARMMTRSHAKGKKSWWLDPVLICVGFNHDDKTAQPRHNCIWVSKDRGENWYGPLYLDTETEDSGYGHWFYNPQTDEYVALLYYGTLTEATIRQYNFNIIWP